MYNVYDKNEFEIDSLLSIGGVISQPNKASISLLRANKRTREIDRVTLIAFQLSLKFWLANEDAPDCDIHHVDANMSRYEEERLCHCTLLSQWIARQILQVRFTINVNSLKKLCVFV